MPETSDPLNLDELRVELLGELRCTRGGDEVPIGGGRRGATLALLALEAPRAVPMSEIIDALWGEDPPDSAVNAVQVYVSGLRSMLGKDTIVRSAAGYRLRSPLTIDVREFCAACELGAKELEDGLAIPAAGTLRSGLALWRGRALGDISSASFVDLEVARLEELRLAAVEGRTEADLLSGRHRELISELEDLVARHPLRERLRAALMRALHRSGRQAEALQVYEDGRRLVADELGLDPSAQLRKLRQDILTDRDQVPEITSAGRAPIPFAFDELVGRSEDLSTLRTAIADPRCRLVTLIGPGGIGKTRLAIELAHELVSSYPDGVVYAALDSATTAADVVATMCAALGVQPGRDATRSLLRSLASLEVLVVCDNFEHVVEAAPVLAEILTAAPRLRILTTSRRPLGLRGERQLVLAPLSTTAADGRSSAVRLFVARAELVNPGLEPDVGELADIATIVRYCDGLPLAIELAAARTKTLSIAELRERIDRPLAVLTSSARDLPERQRTMRANIAWSVQSLDDEQRRFLCRLAVCHGGFALDAAAALGGDDADSALTLVDALVDLSLIRRVPSQDGRSRFEMYATIREYAIELLDEDELREGHTRHARHFRDWLYGGIGGRHGLYDVSDWLALLAEAPNLREAIRWSLAAGDTELTADLIIRCAPNWQALGSPAEFEGWLRALIERDDLSPARRVDAYRSLAWSVADTDPRLMSEPLAAAHALADEYLLEAPLAELARAAATQQLYLGDVAQAAAAVRECAELARRQPDNVTLQLDLLEIQADLAGHTDGVAAGISFLEEALLLAERHRADLRRLLLLYNYCEALIGLDQPDRVVELANEGVALSLRARARGALPDHLSQRGYAHLLLGDGAAALLDLRAACAGHLQLGKTLFSLDTLVRLAAATSDRQPRWAATALAVVESSTEWASEPGADRTIERFLADLPDRLGADYEEAVRDGRLLVERDGGLGAVASLLERVGH